MKILSITICLILFVSMVALADYSEVRNLNLSTDEIRLLRVDCGAGYLEIEGVDGLNSIEVEAEIYIDNINKRDAEDYMDDHMILELDKRGKVAKLDSRFENRNISFGILWNSISAEINLKIKVPKGMELEIDDGSGYTEVKNLSADIEIDDGSGDLLLENIEGRVIIDDGSGEFIAEKIDGEIIIDDGSGDISIMTVTGDVDINDGSGSIQVESVTGSVVVDDGSGNIRIKDVTNDVEIIDDSSGRVSIANVDGDVIR